MSEMVHWLCTMAALQNARFMALFGIFSFNNLHSIPHLDDIATSIADDF